MFNKLVSDQAEPSSTDRQSHLLDAYHDVTGPHGSFVSSYLGDCAVVQGEGATVELHQTYKVLGYSALQGWDQIPRKATWKEKKHILPHGFRPLLLWPNTLDLW